jgi:hypothetical protein
MLLRCTELDAAAGMAYPAKPINKQETIDSEIQCIHLSLFMKI